MAANFDYGQARATLTRIEELKTKLNNTLNNANDLIKGNVNNNNVWNSDTSSAFMTEWTKYAETNFPAYINTFETQIKNINIALETYTSAEM